MCRGRFHFNLPEREANPSDGIKGREIPHTKTLPEPENNHFTIASAPESLKMEIFLRHMWKHRKIRNGKLEPRLGQNVMQMALVPSSSSLLLPFPSERAAGLEEEGGNNAPSINRAFVSFSLGWTRANDKFRLTART
jgi:hypothetical protein